jgi:hypothetical protein
MIPMNQEPDPPTQISRGEIIALISRTQAGGWRAQLSDRGEGYVPATYVKSIANPSHPRHNEWPVRRIAGHSLIDGFGDE